MAVKGRFLITQGPVRPSSGQALRAVADEATGRGRPSWIGWLMLGGNNRELGRSVVRFFDVDECCQAIEALRAATDRVRPGIQADVDAVSWRWSVELDDEAVAASGRLYQRRRECAYALNQFLTALPDAEPPSAPARVLNLSWADWCRASNPADRARSGWADRRPGAQYGTPAVALPTSWAREG